MTQISDIIDDLVVASHILPPSYVAARSHYETIPMCQCYMFGLQLYAASYSASGRAPQVRGPARRAQKTRPSPTAPRPPVVMPAPEGLAEHGPVFGRKRGAAHLFTDGADGQGQGRPDLAWPKSLPEKPAGFSPTVIPDGPLEAGRQTCSRRSLISPVRTACGPDAFPGTPAEGRGSRVQRSLP